MKKIIIFSCVFTMCMYSESKGQDCKYIKNEVDKFTKQKIIKTRGIKLGSYKYNIASNNVTIHFFAYNVNNKKFIEMHIASTTSIHVTEGTELMFLMNNDQVVTLKSFYEETKKLSHLTSGINAFFELNDDNYKTLLNYNITSMRFITFKKDIEIKEKNNDKLKGILKCIE